MIDWAVFNVAAGVVFGLLAIIAIPMFVGGMAGHWLQGTLSIEVHYRMSEAGWMFLGGGLMLSTVTLLGSIKGTIAAWEIVLDVSLVVFGIIASTMTPKRPTPQSSTDCTIAQDNSAEPNEEC